VQQATSALYVPYMSCVQRPCAASRKPDFTAATVIPLDADLAAVSRAAARASWSAARKRDDVRHSRSNSSSCGVFGSLGGLGLAIATNRRRLLLALRPSHVKRQPAKDRSGWNIKGGSPGKRDDL